MICFYPINAAMVFLWTFLCLFQDVSNPVFSDTIQRRISFSLGKSEKRGSWGERWEESSSKDTTVESVTLMMKKNNYRNLIC